ncbi:MAG: hypothetical protein D6696_15760 [Acidobacteria bacterium]|nr:MAG: hypothetical protein D6696_15760 [Acidobacteriota bacterium]
MSTKIALEITEIDLTVLHHRPSQLRVTARGLVPSTGWRHAVLVPNVYDRPPEDGIYDFALVADEHTDLAIPSLTPIVAHHLLEEVPRGFRGVRVRASRNVRLAILAGGTGHCPQVSLRTAGNRRSGRETAPQRRRAS